MCHRRHDKKTHYFARRYKIKLLLHKTFRDDDGEHDRRQQWLIEFWGDLSVNFKPCLIPIHASSSPVDFPSTNGTNSNNDDNNSCSNTNISKKKQKKKKKEKYEPKWWSALFICDTQKLQVGKVDEKVANRKIDYWQAERGFNTGDSITERHFVSFFQIRWSTLCQLYTHLY